jgi:hypothetical protein
MQPIKQARLPLSGEVKLDGLYTYFVGVQNIALARIDVESPTGERRVAVNLYGLRDIDRLIDALQTARATMVTESDALHAYLAAHPEAVLPATLP